MTIDVAAPALPAHLTGDATAHFTRRRFERIMAGVTALGSAALGVQAFLNAVPSQQEDPAWHLPLLVLTFGPLVAMIVTGLAGIGARVGAGLFAVAFPVVLLCWPVATLGRAGEAGPQPWIWYLINVATVAAVIAFRVLLQYVWAVTVPLLYGAVRLVQLGSPEHAVTVALEVVFALILAGVLVTLRRMLVGAAIRFDRVRTEAVASYAEAAAADAAEGERVAVAALMHDSVLAALIAAERAETERERALAVAMSREALTRLANADRDAEEGTDDPVPAEQLGAMIETAATDAGAVVSVDTVASADAPFLPGRVARALTLAAAQAVANAVEHAGGTGLRVHVGVEREGVVVRVVDAGPGFDPDTVPADRLGIRGSIVARTVAVGGHARIASDASGTTVELTWERCP